MADKENDEDEEIEYDLNEKQKLVLDASLKNPTWTKSRCYVVGYPKCSSHAAANSSSSRLFALPESKRYLKNRRFEITKQVDVDVQYVLKGLMNIVEFNHRDMFDEKGAHKALSEIDLDVIKMLDSLNTKRVKTGKKTPDGEDEYKVIISSYRVGDKKGSLELLGKYLKMWSDKLELDFPDLKNRKFNLNFKSYPKHKE